jgi:hypothetical protein
MCVWIHLEVPLYVRACVCMCVRACMCVFYDFKFLYHLQSLQCVFWGNSIRVGLPSPTLCILKEFLGLHACPLEL